MGIATKYARKAAPKIKNQEKKSRKIDKKKKLQK